jgi:hypothetical protein
MPQFGWRKLVSAGLIGAALAKPANRGNPVGARSVLPHGHNWNIIVNKT